MSENDEDANYNTNIEEIYKNALKDPSLMSTLDVDQLLEELENDKNSYLENKTLQIINKEVYDAVEEVVADPEIRQTLCTRLIGYRLVTDICDLHTHKFVKTISLKNPNTTKQRLSGTVIKISFTDTGTKILLFNPPKSFSSYMFHNYITFQKLSDSEQLILMAYEHIT